jgi:hypothetical protein
MSRQAVRRLLPSDLDRRNDSPIPSDEVKNSHAYTERRWYEEAVFLRQFLPFVHQQRIEELKEAGEKHHAETLEAFLGLMPERPGRQWTQEEKRRQSVKCKKRKAARRLPAWLLSRASKRKNNLK